MRYLFGFRGAQLIQSAIDAVNCTRCDATSIENYIATQQSLAGPRADFDGDGEEQPLGDGLAFIRYLFGFRRRPDPRRHRYRQLHPLRRRHPRGLHGRRRSAASAVRAGRYSRSRHRRRRRDVDGGAFSGPGWPRRRARRGAEHASPYGEEPGRPRCGARLRGTARAPQPCSRQNPPTVARFIEDRFLVTCPYCGETVEIYVEPDTEGAVDPGLRGVLQPVARRDLGRRRRASRVRRPRRRFGVVARAVAASRAPLAIRRRRRLPLRRGSSAAPPPARRPGPTAWPSVPDSSARPWCRR